MNNSQFVASNIERYSTVHTKSRLRIAWETNSGALHHTAEYWQVGEDMLACEVQVNSTVSVPQKAAFDMLLMLSGNQQGKTAGFVSTGDEPLRMCVSEQGEAVAVSVVHHSPASGGNGAPVGHSFYKDATTAAEQIGTAFNTSTSSTFAGQGNAVVGALTYQAPLAPAATASWVFVAARASDCPSALMLLHTSDLATPAEVLNQRGVAQDIDNDFWATQPKLSGDWPDFWMHGLVLDSGICAARPSLEAFALALRDLVWPVLR